jgi:C1A family cysteine protease
MKRITWVLFSSLFAFSASGQALTLQTLRAKLNAAHAGWVAGETKVSVLSHDDQKRLLGSNFPDQTDFFYPRKKVTTYGNSSWDWRSVGGKNYASPILDQGRCGSCVAFASIAQLETQMNITRKTMDSPWAFSPQHLFACGGGACEKGWMPYSALSFLQSNGVPDEACFPYTSGAVGDDVSCSRTCTDAKSRSQKIVRYATTSFFFASTAGLKRALEKGPLLATMTVYEDLMFYKSGVYQHTTGKALGGHAVVIEGWDDATSSWLVRNNWGADWGEKGYFRIGWDDDSGVGRNTWSIEVPASQDGLVSLGSLRDHAVLSSHAQAIQLESTFADTNKIRWQLSNGTRTVAEGSAARSSTVVMDTTALPDGAYQLVALADRKSGEVRSQPRDVYILNGALTGSLKFNNLKDGDVLSDKKILECDLQSAPIPFSQVIFRAKNLATGEVVDRRTTNIAGKINLSFYTPRVANGDWELSLEGQAGLQSVNSAPVKVSIKN